MAHTNGMTRRKAAYVEALAAGNTRKRAAELAGVSLRTAARYSGDALVIEALHELTDEALSGAARRLGAGAGNMLEVLRAITDDTSLTPSVRLRAADIWLSALFRAREAVELTARVVELERLAKVVTDEH